MRLKSFMVLSLLGLSFLTVAATREVPSDDESLVLRISQSAVRLVTSDERPAGSGSFVHINDRFGILTNDHVCALYKDRVAHVLIHSQGNVHITAPILASSVEADLCFIPLPKSLLATFTPLHLKIFTFPFSRILIMGYPMSGPLTPSFGHILIRAIVDVAVPETKGCPKIVEGFFGKYCIQSEELELTNCYTFPGNSGSPAVDMDGNLVGVLNSGNGDTHYGNIIPGDRILAFFKGI